MSLRRHYIYMRRQKDLTTIVSDAYELARQLKLLYEFYGWEAYKEGFLPHHPAMDTLLAEVRCKRRQINES